jgi:hypothetical protein
MPVPVKTRLNTLVSMKFKVFLRGRKEPVRCILTSDLLHTSQPPIEDETVCCCLAIVDFGRNPQNLWLPEQLRSFFRMVFDYTTSETVVIAIFIRPS